MHRHNQVEGSPMGRETHQYIVYTYHQYVGCELVRLSSWHSRVCLMLVLDIRAGVDTWKGKHKIGPFSTPAWKPPTCTIYLLGSCMHAYLAYRCCSHIKSQTKESVFTQRKVVEPQEDPKTHKNTRDEERAHMKRNQRAN